MGGNPSLAWAGVSGCWVWAPSQHIRLSLEQGGKQAAPSPGSLHTHSCVPLLLPAASPCQEPQQHLQQLISQIQLVPGASPSAPLNSAALGSSSQDWPSTRHSLHISHCPQHAPAVKELGKIQEGASNGKYCEWLSLKYRCNCNK